MKPWLKILLVSLALLLFVFAVCRLSWPALPVPLRVKIIRADYALGNDWYPTYDRLGDMLKLGMTMDEVHAILGKPAIDETVAGGKRWEYLQSGPTSGSGCVVDFAPDGNTLRLCYFVDYGHLMFRDSPHRDFGSPVDGGKFETDPGLDQRWHEWHGIQSNAAPQPTNSVSHASSKKPTNSPPTDLQAQLRRIGYENGVGVSIVTNTHMISIISTGSSQGFTNTAKATDAIRKYLGNDFTNYQIMPSFY